MFRVLVKKALNESIALWIACALVLFIFPWVRIWTVSQFELTGFAPLIDQFRAFEKFSPVPLEQFLSYHGVIALTFDEPVLILCILVWSVARGSDVVSGEVGRGTMEMLLAQPVRRSHVYWSHALVTTLGLACLCLLVFAGLYFGIVTNSTPMEERPTFHIPFIDLTLNNIFATSHKRLVPLTELVSPATYIAPTINLFGLGFAVLGFSAMVSSFDQFRWRTIGITIGTYVLQLLLLILSKSTPMMAWLKPGSFIAAYQPDWMVRIIHHNPERAWYWWVGSSTSAWDECLGPMSYSVILIGIGMISMVIGSWRFQIRDLPAPL